MDTSRQEWSGLSVLFQGNLRPRDQTYQVLYLQAVSLLSVSPGKLLFRIAVNRRQQTTGLCWSSVLWPAPPSQVAFCPENREERKGYAGNTVQFINLEPSSGRGLFSSGCNTRKCPGTSECRDWLGRDFGHMAFGAGVFKYRFWERRKWGSKWLKSLRAIEWWRRGKAKI